MGGEEWYPFSLQIVDRLCNIAKPNIAGKTLVMLFSWILALHPSVAQANEVVTPPRPVAASGLSDMDYPEEALRLKQEGVSVVLVQVGKNGKAQSCSVQESSGSPSLDDATCKLFGGIRFKPARDAQGKAIAAGTALRMSWKLPRP